MTNRLRFLDGLRGLAALYIVLHHAFQIGGMVQANDHLSGSRIDQVIKAIYYGVFSYGYGAVTIFIVLSGYSLMLPVVRAQNGELPGGVRGYFWRRARRIVPPYYAALGFSLFTFVLFPKLNQPGDVWWSAATPAFDLQAFLAHLLLIQNWDQAWLTRINMPMWSVAVEWQIYMLLPSIFLPVWRRFGAIPMLVTGLALGLLPELCFGKLPFCERFIAMFALGAFGACVGFDRRLTKLKDLCPWRLGALAGLLGFGCFVAASFKFWLRTKHFQWVHVDRYDQEPMKDLLIGIVTVCLIITYAKHEGRPWGQRVLEHPVSTGLSRFSYSLYLIHAPILCALAVTGLELGISPTAGYLGLVLIGTPLSLAVSWLFYRAFEKPFLQRREAGVQEARYTHEMVR